MAAPPPLVDAFGYRNVSVEGFEADDVIAAISAGEGTGVPVMVVTGDRDAYGFVDDGVRIMTTSRGVTNTKVYDRDGVIDRYGIPPMKVPTSSASKATHPTTSPASPAPSTRPRPSCSSGSATSRGVLPAPTGSPAPSASRT